VPYWLIGLILMISVSVFAAARSRGPAASPTPVPDKQASARKLLGASVAEVETLLDSIERKDTPEPVMGAMCYEMAACPSVIEYICPVCGERTVYEGGSDLWNVQELFTIRALFDSLAACTDADLLLDETSFCSFCGDVSTEPAPLLVVDLDDADPCTSVVDADDLRVLIGFFFGKTSYATVNDGSLPLKPELDRIRTLLGLRGER